MSKETATPEKIDAAIQAFTNERLRWLVGKGDVLMQDGELTKERYDELIAKAVKDEIHRCMILQQFDETPKTISALRKEVDIDENLKRKLYFAICFPTELMLNVEQNP